MRSSLSAMVGIVLVGTTVVSCVPSTSNPPAPTTAAPATTTPVVAPTTSPSAPHAPAVAWSPGTPTGSSPVTTDLTWSASDPDGDTLTCRLDLDGNGSFELTISPCPSTGARTRTYTSTTTATIEVSDGSATATSATTVTVGAPSSDQFEVALRLGGTMSPTQTQAFTDAAAKWSSIIKTGQPDRSVTFAANSCASGTASYSGTIDDLMIDAQLVTIDGPGGVLGQAGPCLVRSSNGIPIYGIMQFDSADAASLESSGQLTNTIIHEMGHILGIGTVWDDFGVLSGAGGSNPVFTGSAAFGIWQALGGAGSIPVENSGGPGTADSHWRETTFRTELMTGYLNGTNQLSALSVASLADLGYGVDLAGADPYVLSTLRAASVHADHADEHDHLGTIEPIGSV